MSRRFFAPNLAAAAGEFILADDEAHHLLSVCRSQLGELVELFDGQGTVASARLLAATRRTVRLQLIERRAVPYRGLGLVLACSLPKGDRAATLIEKCTELGVWRIVPIATERSVVEPGQGKLDKLRRTVVEACKQSGRDHLLEVSPLTSWQQLAGQASGVRWLLDPSAATATVEATAVPNVVAVGPEGGFTDSEVALAQEHGWTCVSLPGDVLRVETAAIAVAAWVRLRTGS